MKYLFPHSGKKVNLSKLIASVLVFSFVVVSPISVFAQETTPTEETPSTDPQPQTPNEESLPQETTQEENSEDIETPKENESESEEESELEPIDEEEPQSLLDEEPDEELDPTQGIFDNKKFAQVDESSGMLKFEIPFIFPKGRNGLEPDLALQYSSNHSPEGSIVGYGWSLSIPYIQRINNRGLNNMYSDSYFSSSLSGELATSTASSTLYRAKVETGDFIKYSFINDVWIATDKDGVKYTFGTSTDSRQDDPADSTKIYKWYLTEIRDTNDNFIKYAYYKDSVKGQMYPSKIYYTGNGSTDGIFEIEFTRASSLDLSPSAASGFYVETQSRISEITAKILIQSISTTRPRPNINRKIDV